MNEPHLHALRDVVDRQLFDAETLMLGKADDLAFDEHDDHGPRLTAIITGTAAFARRFDGRWRGIIEWLAVRASARPEPTFLPVEIVDRTRTSLHAHVRKDAIDAAQRVPAPTGAFAGLATMRNQMRLSELIDTQCVDREQLPLGRVGDAVLATPSSTDDGPALVPAYIAGLAVGLGAFGDRLGYELEHGPHVPAAVRFVMRHLARHALFVPWEHVERRDERTVYLSVVRDALPSLESMEHAART